jgi:acetoin utilization deacetylase AcuC-like enzyme
MEKFSGLYQYLITRRIIQPEHVIEPKMAGFSSLCAAHTTRYSHAVWNGSLSGKEIRRIGLPWTKGLAIRSRLAVQGTINASIMALEDGISGNLAGGTHHAMPDKGEGFCVYNDVAVAIRVLKQARWVKKVLVIDCDVHQGNGTAEIFRDDDDVYTFSIHGANNYPFIKPASTFDVGLEDGTEDKEYLLNLDKALEKIFNEFKPDLVYYLAGIDPLKTDHFGRLSLTLKGLKERERLVIDTVVSNNYPLVLLLSGGYAPTLRETVEAHAILFEMAKDISSPLFQ